MGLSPWCGKVFFRFQCKLLKVSMQPLCAIVCISIYARIKNPKHWQPYHCLEAKILHMLIGKGCAVLVAAVPYPGKARTKKKKKEVLSLKQ